MSPFNLQTCARPNILGLQPYRCARDDYKDDGTNILLDANENAYGPGLSLNGSGKLGPERTRENNEEEHELIDVDLLGLNRYPDPHQIPLKQLLCDLRNITPNSPNPLKPSNLFVGVGSDEAIDALLRAFCRPSIDRIIVCPPTYGMYSVSAAVNDISLVKIPLLLPSFDVDVDSIMQTLSSPDASTIKLVYLCSPGNPTAKLVQKASVEKLLTHPTWNGVIVVDEAYIDFASPGSSCAEMAPSYPNLVIMQTLSKAFGLAGIRLGTVFTSPDIAQLLNNMKAPYNIPNPTSQLAQAALTPKHLAHMRSNMAKIVAQRDRLVAELPKIRGVGNFKGGFDANFLLTEMLDRDGKPSNVTALAVYERLAEEKGVVVRFRGKEYGCEGCLRITVGTETEVDRFLEELRGVLGDVVYGESRTDRVGGKGGDEEQERREVRESAVVG